MNHAHDWLMYERIFHDRRRRIERRNVEGRYPAHLSFSRCRRTDNDRRGGSVVQQSPWWLNTNYLNWEAGIHPLPKRRRRAAGAN